MGKNNRITLVQPWIPDRNYIPNLGILYLAAVLEQDGFRVQVLDENLERDYEKKLVSFDPYIIGFTAVTAAINRVIRSAKRLKGVLPSIKNVVGGPHASLLAAEVISSPGIDFCLKGEGEFPFLELARALREGRGVEDIPNLVYQRDGETVENPSRHLLSSDELDQLPFPAFHLLDLEKVFPNIAHGLYSRGQRILPIMTSRGCPHSCTFCCRVMGKSIRSRSPENVLKEIGYMIEHYRVDEIYFEDDNFTVDRNRALDILQGIHDRFPGLYIKFANGLRVDRVDEKFLHALRAAGGYWVGFGIESGVERILKMMKKNLDLEVAKKNVALARRLGFRIGANFIIGYPGENWKDILASLSFFRGLDLDSLAIVNLIPFPGTAVHELCRKKGYLTAAAADYDNYYFGIINIKTLIRTPSLPPWKLKMAIWISYFVFYFLSWKRLKKFSYMAFTRIIIPFRVKRK